MDISSPLFNSYGIGEQYHWSYPSSDSEFYNVSSPETCILSPSTCRDFSPSSLPQGTGSGPHRALHSGGAKASSSLSSSDEGGLSGERTRKSRSKNPSKQRQSASEKEKLRMRDLTKALHHLRTYLPPSVAPAGQTLTKIETLRLTIGYISHLSAQLGLGGESVFRRNGLNLNSSGHQVSPQQESAGQCQFNASFSGYCWGEEAQLGRHSNEQQTTHTVPSTYPLLKTTRADTQPRETDACAYDDAFNSSMDSLSESPGYIETTQSHQVCFLFCLS
ncbi:mesoderm posterior bb [Esox lucius]|uniref:mesoderm posterior bb n=1 Tax=Esox lucius TaxID=8010 RepID=UPI0009733107|nr:mesoderm posterior bb [Esox lucius]